MTSRVIVICKSWLEASPPVLATIHALRCTGKSVLCICSGCRRETKAELEEVGVAVEQIYAENPHPGDTFGKIMHYAKFRRRAWQILDSEDPRAVIWVARMDTAIALGRRLLQRSYILSVFELHEQSFLYQHAIGLYAPRASIVVVPEFCRASILRCRYRLAKPPFVLPNKPILRPGKRDAVVSDPVAAQTLASIPRESRILLYQGALERDRDIEPVARATHQLGEAYRLLIMGEDRTGDLGRLRQVCPRLIYIPWLRPPVHLEVISHAHIGIAFYKFDSLNSIFCAPNKIWEYSAYGIPMICQDIPGLRYTVGTAGAGVCVECGDIEGIVNGIKAIETDYEHYSNKAMKFFESVDTISMVARIVDDLCQKRAPRQEPHHGVGCGNGMEPN